MNMMAEMSTAFVLSWCMDPVTVRAAPQKVIFIHYRMPQWIGMVVWTILALLMLAFPASGQSKPGEASAALVGRPAPSIELNTADGTRFDLASQKGKIVIVAFWATWCEPCRGEIPRLIAFQREYASKDVTVIGISAEDPTVVRGFLASERFDFPTAIDSGKRVSDAYGVDLVPRTFILDRTGTVVKMIRGAPGESSLRRAIEAADRR